MSNLKNIEKAPVYQKLKETIIKEIEINTLKEGDIILSERLLGEQFNISRISVRKAISELVEENYLYTVPGKGTFVKGLRSEGQKKKQKTFNLGYIFWGAPEDVIKNPYFSHFIQGAQKEAIKYNYHLLISSLREVKKDGKIIIPSVISQEKVDGVLLEGIELDAYKNLSRILPCVIISNYIRNETTSSDSLEDYDLVIANDYNATINVLKYLKDLGHKKIGFVYENLNHSSFYNRYAGFLSGTEKYNLITKKDWIVEGNDPKACIEKIFKSSDKPTVIIAGNDVFALEMIDWCIENKIKVPADLSIIGYDDIERSMWSQPALTTVKVLTEDMGKLAARRLIEKIDDPSIASTHILVGTNLIIRDSCASLKK